MHPINTYDTPLEQEQLEFISRTFSIWDIVNPSESVHQNMVAHLKRQKSNVMDYFRKLASECDGGIILPFRDGTIGSGVWKEFDQMVLAGSPVWELTHDGVFSKLDGIDQDRRLSLEATRAMIRHKDGSPRPY